MIALVCAPSDNSDTSDYHHQPRKEEQTMTEQIPRMDSTLAALDRLMSENSDNDDDHEEA